MPKTNVNRIAIQYRRFNDWVRGELKYRHMNQAELAEYLNLSRSSLTLRLLGKVEWTFKEVLNTCEFFDRTLEEIL